MYYLCIRVQLKAQPSRRVPGNLIWLFVMAFQFGKFTAEIGYKGHFIQTTESPMQIVYVVDGDLEHAYWSVADAKRAINGKELKYLPVDVRHWFR